MSHGRARSGFIVVQALLLIVNQAWAQDLCSGCKIYILDLSSLALANGFPTCEPDDRVVVAPGNGVVYLKGHQFSPQVTASHKFGTHSAPYYLYKAIENSPCVTNDLDSADVVYVYDYCYYIWWLAHVHTVGRKELDTPGDYLIQGWTAMTKLPKWQANGGREFVFYDPHPGFASGKAEQPFIGMQCNEFRHATHIVVERAQRNTCQSYLEISKQLITPYVPNFISSSNPMDTFIRPNVPRSKRNITVYFSGKCIPFKGDNVGKKMRYATVQALQNAGQDTEIKCSEIGTVAEQPETFDVMLDKMERSVFCLVLAGDAQSTRRLSEIFLAGCIPVFLGPPYNSMPLAEDVNYKSVGVFFNISSYKSWLPEQAEWVIGSERAKYGQEAKWWVPDADVTDRMITVDSVQDIMAHLRGMPDAEIDRKLREMQDERRRFTFQESLSGAYPHAASSIIKYMCQAAKSSASSATTTAHGTAFGILGHTNANTIGSTHSVSSVQQQAGNAFDQKHLDFSGRSNAKQNQSPVLNQKPLANQASVTQHDPFSGASSATGSLSSHKDASGKVSGAGNAFSSAAVGVLPSQKVGAAGAFRAGGENVFSLSDNKLRP